MTRWATLDGQAPRIIAHRGASGLLPEHTLEAYALALAQGADVIEPDLVISRDGELIVRHDATLARSTDIATHARFLERSHDGDWPIDAFDADELALLRARQPFAQRDPSHDGRYRIPRFVDALEWAARSGHERRTPVTLYPELKHVAEFALRGRDPVPRFVELARAADSGAVRVWLQCFEPDPLQRVAERIDLPRFLLRDVDADWRADLRRYAGEFQGLAVAKSLLYDGRGHDSGLVAEAHALGLQVHAWTYRDDMLPTGVSAVDEELDRAFALGVDALFCDFPATGLARRALFAATN